MLEDTENISRKTWSRNIEPVTKMGYMDGAADGQAAAFQSSFDMGFKQGFSFGFELGLRNVISLHENSSNHGIPADPRRINCKICMNGIPSEENLVNLYNAQQESNNELIK